MATWTKLIGSRHRDRGQRNMAIICGLACVVVAAIVVLNVGRSDNGRAQSFDTPIKVPVAALRRAELGSTPTWDSVKVPNVIHAIRVWGTRIDLPLGSHGSGNPVYTGRTLLNYCLGLGLPREDQIPGWQTILQRTEFGVNVVNYPALRGGFTEGKAHRDDLLEACAVNAIPLSTPVFVDGEELTLRHLLNHSLATYHDRAELEWSAVVYATYLPPQSSWENRFGERSNFDELIDALVGRRPSQCACYGLHIPYALASIVHPHRLPMVG